MKVEVNCACTETIDISEEEAFRILCRTLYMDCVLDDISEFFIKRDEYGCLGVYKKSEVDMSIVMNAGIYSSL